MVKNSSSKAPFLSVVIPAYNEAERLSLTLPQIIKFFLSQKFTVEILVVNDGSSDSTAKVVKLFTRTTKLLKLIDCRVNQGKGGALRTGFAHSRGQWVLFMDADLSTPLNELNKFWKHGDNHPIIIGSRKTKGAKVSVRQSLIRENLGKVFTWLTNHIATKDISDVTCGFKLFRGDEGRRLFRTSVVNDWSFDAEILFLAQRRNLKIKEVPVAWQNDPRTKVNMLNDGVKALWGLIKIRLNHIQGKY